MDTAAAIKNSFMKLYVIAAAFVLTACAHGTAQKNNKTAGGPPNNALRCFKVTQTFPLRNEFGELKGYDTFYAFIYTLNEQLLYRTSYQHTFLKTEDNAFVPDYIVRRYSNFVFTEGQPMGALYDTQKNIINRPVRADSMLRDLWLSRLSILNGPMAIDTFNTARTWLSGDTTLYEAYTAKLKRDTSFKAEGSMQLWYTRPLAGSPFSFNRTLDSLRGQQVCRVHIKNRLEFVMEGQQRVSEFEQHYQLAEIPVTNAAELLPYFERQRRGQYNVPLKVGGLQ
jgi:hypothetical protein